MGSLRAATSNGMWSGTTSRLVPRTAFSISRYSDSAPLAPPLPMIPLRCGHRVDDDMVAHCDTNDVAADLDDLARRLVTQRHAVPGRGIPPIEMKNASEPQIPQARIFTSTSAGPTVGFGASTTRVSPGAVTTDTFICTLLYSGSRL